MTALIKGLDSTFYLFDSHARNNNGMPDPNGTAVVMKFDNLSEFTASFIFFVKSIKYQSF